jgi:DNA-binding response OmpR family regulator
MTATDLLIDTAGLLDVSELAPEANGTGQSVRNEGRLDYIAALALDSYRIALIAPQVSSAEHPSANRLGSGRLVILPLTWKQFLVEVQKCASDATNTGEQESAQFGQVSIDFKSMEVRRSNRIVSVTPLEFKVMKFFVLNPRKVISREDLLNQVWGFNAYPCTRTVDAHMSKLRRKLESDAARPVHFQTVHGIGYKFVP